MTEKLFCDNCNKDVTFLHYFVIEEEIGEDDFKNKDFSVVFDYSPMHFCSISCLLSYIRTHVFVNWGGQVGLDIDG